MAQIQPQGKAKISAYFTMPLPEVNDSDDLRVSSDDEKDLLLGFTDGAGLSDLQVRGIHVEGTLQYLVIDQDFPNRRAVIEVSYIINDGDLRNGSYRFIASTSYWVKFEKSKEGKRRIVDAVHSDRSWYLQVSLGNAFCPYGSGSQSLPLQSSEGLKFMEQHENGQVISKPSFSRFQLDEIFSRRGKVTFAIIYNGNTFDPTATSLGDESSFLFQKLAKSKLFALAFADLYQLNRKLLDATARSKFGERQQVVIQIYFQRYAEDLDSFGARARLTTERDCLNRYTHHPDTYKYFSFCAPLVRVVLSLRENGGEIRSRTIVPDTQLPYGPGTGREIVNTEQILNTINSFPDRRDP